MSVAAAGGTSRRAARAIEYGAMREQLLKQLRASEIARRRTKANCASGASTSPSGELRAGGAGGGLLSSARDDDGSWIQSAMREQLASVCIRFVMCASR